MKIGHVDGQAELVGKLGITYRAGAVEYNHLGVGFNLVFILQIRSLKTLTTLFAFKSFATFFQVKFEAHLSGEKLLA